MWITLNGPRVLTKLEDDLISAAMIDLAESAFAEISDREQPFYDHANTRNASERRDGTGVTWFDQWEPEQRLWLLEHLYQALTIESIPPPNRSAMFEATFEAIFSVITEKVMDSSLQAGMESTNSIQWQELLSSAFLSQSSSKNLNSFLREDTIDFPALAQFIQNSVVGPTCYEQAEMFRDGPPDTLNRFLQSKGLPEGYLSEIPPLPSDRETQLRVNRLKDLLDRPKDL